MENLKKILKDVKVDKSIDHLSKIKKITQVVSKYDFSVNDNKYVVDFTTEYSDKTSKTSVSFKNISAIEKLKSKKHDTMSDLYTNLDQAKYGLTKTGNSMKIFNEIYNVVGKYILSEKPDFFQFEAVEDNRKSLYEHLINRIQKELPLKFERIYNDPFTGDGLSKTSQRFIYKMDYNE